jgi:hypothetical protein
VRVKRSRTSLLNYYSGPHRGQMSVDYIGVVKATTPSGSNVEQHCGAEVNVCGCVGVSVEGNCFELEYFGQKKRGKLLVSHRYNLLPLLRSRPGGFRGSWSYKTYPTTKLNRFFGFWVCR